MRLRPMHDPRFHFNIPEEIEPEDTLVGWSSFPSDHAIVICAFATAVLFWSWRLGLLAWIWALIVVVWPRVYLGLHYPTDMLAGVVIGTAVMVAALRAPMPRPLLDLPGRLEARHPSLFYALAFLATYQLGTNFDDLRALGSAFWEALR
jgi:undecaprenyl-diphosphatase